MGRSSLLVLTQGGRQVMRRVEQQRSQVLQEMFKEWGDGDRRDLAGAHEVERHAHRARRRAAEPELHDPPAGCRCRRFGVLGRHRPTTI